jgi:membrane protein
MKGVVAKVDRYQRGHRWLGFTLGVAKRFGEDKAGHLAALVAYYGFFSLFPLMMVLVTAVGTFAADNPELRDQILDSALKQFPVVGTQIRENIQATQDSGVALVVGIAGALWAGLAGVKAAQNAMDQVWDVPVKRQPKFFQALLRAVIMLATLGVFVLLAGFIGGVAAGTETAPMWLQVMGVVGAFVLNFLVFWVAFRVLTVADVSWGDVFPGALLGSILWSILQALGGYIIGQRLESASEVYGFFGVVIGLLSWLYLGAQVTLLAAETNVVRVKHLWPRSLDPDDLTQADRRALELLAEVEERHEEQRVDVRFDDGPRSRGRDGSGDGAQERSRGKTLISFGAGVLVGVAGALLRGRRPRSPQ